MFLDITVLCKGGILIICSNTENSSGILQLGNSLTFPFYTHYFFCPRLITKESCFSYFILQNTGRIFPFLRVEKVSNISNDEKKKDFCDSSPLCYGLNVYKGSDFWQVKCVPSFQFFQWNNTKNCVGKWEMQLLGFIPYNKQILKNNLINFF